MRHTKVIATIGPSSDSDEIIRAFYTVEQIDAYARGDFKTAYSVTYEGYQHMFAVAETLSVAIGPTIAARLPKGGVQTGGGGMAGSR